MLTVFAADLTYKIAGQQHSSVQIIYSKNDFFSLRTQLMPK